MRIRTLIAPLCVILLTVAPTAAFADTSFNQLLGQFEQEYQLPSGILTKIALAENSGKATGCSSASSACGMFQFIASTWERATLAMYNNGQPLDPSLRNNPEISAKVAAFELANIKNQIGSLASQANVNLSTALYLGHFLGAGGARTILSAYLQNQGQSSCSLLPKACAANQSIMASRTVSQLINWASQKMQVTGVLDVPGNFQDSQGISYAYSYADISSSNFLPANTVIPPNPYGQQYATVFPATTNSSVAPAGATGTAAPISSPSAPTVTAAQPTVSPSTGTTGAAASACTPQYYCSNNTVYYKSDSCAVSTFQMCQYGCQGTICAPPPFSSNTSLSVNAQQLASPLTSSGSAIGSPVTIATPVFATSSLIGTAFSSLLSASTSTALQYQNPAQASTSGISYATNSESSSFDSVTLTSNNYAESYVAPVSPFFQILNQLKGVLSGLLSYLSSL